MRLTEGAWKGAYDPSFTERVYEEVIRRASQVLASGRPVIIDASFRSAATRRAARELAERHKVPFTFVECKADPAVCKDRLRTRSGEPTVSDGRLEIFDDFCARWEPVTELSPDEHRALDTGRPLEETRAALRESLPTWPRGLVT